MEPNNWVVEVARGPAKLAILSASLLLLSACGGSTFWAEYEGQPGEKPGWLEVTVGDSAVLAWNKSKIEETTGSLQSINISPAPIDGVIDPATSGLNFVPEYSAAYTAVFDGSTGSKTETSNDLIVLREYCQGDSDNGSYSLQLDLQLPDGTEYSDPRPAILFIHPSSWKARDYSDMYIYMPEATSRGYVAISINYRLSQEDVVIWPGHIQDAKCAVRWLRANASTYNINPDAIAAVGHSAGGHLAALLGVTDASTDPVKQALIEGFKDVGSHQGIDDTVQAVVSLSGPHHLQSTYFEVLANYTSEPMETFSWLFGELPVEGVYNETYDQASPTYFVDADSAVKPYLIINSLGDDIVLAAQGCRLRDALEDAGANNTTMLLYPSGLHWSFIKARGARAVTGGRITDTTTNIFEFLGHHMLGTIDVPQYQGGTQVDAADCDDIMSD